MRNELEHRAGWFARASRLAIVTSLACLTHSAVLGTLCGQAHAASAPVARFAVVIGNNHAPGVETLRYADDDALAMHRLFLDANVQSRMLVSFDAATRELHPRGVSTGAATLENLEREMAAVETSIRASAARGEATELYFFYSGHGDVEGGEGRLQLEDHALTRGQLYELLEASSASVKHVFLDACSSFLVAAKRADAQRRQPIDPTFSSGQTPDALADVGFVLSSSSDRESHEWERYEAGIVSHELRSALRGAADADLDGSISYAELAAFLRQANRAIRIPRLRPEPFVAPPGKNWQQPVLSWQPGSVSVRVRGGATGHFFVENTRGERVLDAHPTVAQWLNLHLPPERPLFIRGHERSAEYELASWAPADVSELSSVALAPPQPKGAEALALRQLFAAPFGQADVLAYERVVASAPERAVAPPPDRAPSPWLRPLGYATLGAAAIGGALSTLALVTYLDARDGSQIEAHRANERIERYNQLSLIPYATAASTAILWGWLHFSEDGTPSAMRWTPVITAAELGLGVEGRF